ncbi:hypothetical protein [Planctomicrobium piriforme]|uniref:Uncharacterized protein n=1 Tax=Planctomicrobium piriforme TaxID=1576369 RepID=A0A1I3HVI0_9PLAN|nr:hypothetical protein [Planctomicrobium piriforme]SFI39734.1 hypothetical protein SAMN05421753_108209 [Planctomicrobium piriforme]
MAQSTGQGQSWGVRLAVFLAAISASLLLFLGLAWYLASSEANAQLALLRQQGMPTNGSELKEFNKIPAGTPDATEAWTQAIEAVDATDLYKRGQALPIVGTVMTIIPPPGTDWAELNASRAFLEELGQELELIRQAAQTPGEARFPRDDNAGVDIMVPSIQAVRGAAQLLLLDAHVQAHAENGGLALQDLSHIFAISDALEREPCVVGQFVRIAIFSIGCSGVTELLNHCQWSDAELATLQSAVASADFKAGMQTAMIGERVLGLDIISNLPLGPLVSTNQSEILRIFKASIESYSLPWPVLLQRQDELEQENARMSVKPLSSILRSLAPLVSVTQRQTATATARAVVRQRATILAIAAQRYQLQHGKCPESLADIPTALLPPGQADELRTDPFNGLPLHLKLDGTRLVIYSVGEDKQDDGGEVLDGKDATDIGVRLQP